MPYTKPEDRTKFIAIDGELNSGFAAMETQGELNYVLTLVVKSYLRQHGLKYSTINDIMGALSGAAKEFYRRVAAPYEDQKIKENGDVY